VPVVPLRHSHDDLHSGVVRSPSPPFVSRAARAARAAHAAHAAVGWLGGLACVAALGGLIGCEPEEAACATDDAGVCLIDAPPTAWSMGPAMPRRAFAAGVAAHGLEVVVAGGFATGEAEGLEITARVDAFDTSAGTWRALADAPVRWTHPNIASVGRTLYLMGGLEGPGRVARGAAFALDALTQTWRPIARLDPGDARGAAGVTTAPGRVYLLGGASSTTALATCVEYDIARDVWLHLPDLPEPRVQPAVMRTPDGVLIVAGGFASLGTSEPRTEVWALTPPGSVPRRWEPRAPLPADPGTRAGCAYGVVLGELVCAGGEGGSAARGAVESYAPYTDVWTAREAMPVDRAGTQAAAIGGRLFIPGGAGTATIAPTDTLYIYTPLDTAVR
jgi:hypothetical protein